MNLYSKETASKHACRLPEQPAGRLPEKLSFSPAELEYFPLPNWPGTPQLQIAEQLFDWGGGNQGRAAKETAEG